MTRRKKNKSSIGCLFWIALILLILVIFLFNRKTIQSVIEETGFLDIVNKERTEPKVERVDVPEKTAGTEEEGGIIEIAPGKEIEETIKVLPADEDAKETAMETGLEKEKPQPEKPEIPRKVRRSKLFFVEVSEDGAIQQKEIVRPVYYVDSPLTATINTLIEGLSGSELNMGLISLIPKETKLLSVNIKDKTAYLNFSESFRFNSFGREGYAAQLKQIVYTATEFSNIDSVQFMIEGSISEYIGPEGGYIGSALSRADLQGQ